MKYFIKHTIIVQEILWIVALALDNKPVYPRSSASTFPMSGVQIGELNHSHIETTTILPLSFAKRSLGKSRRAHTRSCDDYSVYMAYHLGVFVWFRDNYAALSFPAVDNDNAFHHPLVTFTASDAQAIALALHFRETKGNKRHVKKWQHLSVRVIASLHTL